MLSSLLVIFMGVAQADNGKFTYVELEEPCPFKGTLLDEEAMSHLLALSDFEQEKCNIRMEKELALQQNECNLQINKLKSDVEFHKSEVDRVTKEKDDVIESLEGQLKNCKKNDNPIVFSVGVAVGVTITYLFVKALGGT